MSATTKAPDAGQVIEILPACCRATRRRCRGTMWRTAWRATTMAPVALEPGDTPLALSELDPGVLRGAGELLRRRRPATAAHTVEPLRRAFGRLDSERTGGEAAVLVASKR